MFLDLVEIGWQSGVRCSNSRSDLARNASERLGLPKLMFTLVVFQNSRARIAAHRRPLIPENFIPFVSQIEKFCWFSAKPSGCYTSCIYCQIKLFQVDLFFNTRTITKVSLVSLHFAPVSNSPLGTTRLIMTCMVTLSSSKSFTEDKNGNFDLPVAADVVCPWFVFVDQQVCVKCPFSYISSTKGWC